MARDPRDLVQAAGKLMIIYTFSLMKTGEIHDLNNDAWLRPVDKLSAALDQLIKLERQAITLFVSEGVAKINSHALWLDSATQEQVIELEKWLARREAGGIIFKKRPSADLLKTFFHHFARFVPPEGVTHQMAALEETLARHGVDCIKLAPQALNLEGVGAGVRGVASLWYYAKSVAAVSDLLSRQPIHVASAMRLAQDLVDACAVEQDFLLALPHLSKGTGAAQRAVDVAVHCAAVGRGLGLGRVECAQLTLAGLLHVAGHAYENPDPTEFTVPEVVGVLAAQQLVEGARLSGAFGARVAASIDHGIGPEGKGAPYLVSPPKPLPFSQLISLVRWYLDTSRDGDSSSLRAALRLLKAPPKDIAPELAKVFVGVVGLMPVGTVVELQNADLAIICDVDHLRGKDRHGQHPPPVVGPRKVFVERMRTQRGQVIPERRARVELGTLDERGDTWAVVRTLKRQGNEDLVMRALIRRPSTVVAQMGLR